ncbi:MAG: purine-nucleoside phosphorylase [Gemmatimonadota bacterium]|nr:purine-nucleoside phosphorylase [Gemmatimonadota bacterium]
MTSQWGRDTATAAAAAVRARADVGAPVLALILGSGLGSVVDRIKAVSSVPYVTIPGFAGTAVEGHAGTLVAGTLAGRPVIVFAGRIHMYEGHPAAAAAFSVRVAHALGARALLATNAAGGVDPTLVPGDLVLIEDQLNLTGQNPLTGAVERGDLRFPDMSAAYSPRLRALLSEAAGGHPLRRGVYAGLLGPAYETPAEVRMLRTLGADVTGMSTVGEAIVAAALGMEFAGVSLVTNLAAGITDAPVRHDDVIEAGRVASARLGDLLEAFVGRL